MLCRRLGVHEHVVLVVRILNDKQATRQAPTVIVGVSQVERKLKIPLTMPLVEHRPVHSGVCGRLRKLAKLARVGCLDLNQVQVAGRGVLDDGVNPAACDRIHQLNVPLGNDKHTHLVQVPFPPRVSIGTIVHATPVLALHRPTVTQHPQLDRQRARIPTPAWVNRIVWLTPPLG